MVALSVEKGPSHRHRRLQTHVQRTSAYACIYIYIYKCECIHTSRYRYIYIYNTHIYICIGTRTDQPLLDYMIVSGPERIPRVKADETGGGLEQKKGSWGLGFRVPACSHVGLRRLGVFRG